MDSNTTIDRRVDLTRRDLERSNDPTSCLWCGRKLRLAPFSRYPGARGAYADNAFCGLRCGWTFGVLAAKSGFRLKPYTGDPWK